MITVGVGMCLLMITGLALGALALRPREAARGPRPFATPVAQAPASVNYEAEPGLTWTFPPSFAWSGSEKPTAQ